MKKTLVFLFTLFVCIGVHAQTVTTKDRCYFLSDEQGLANLYKVTLDEAKIGTIPKGKVIPVLGIDTIQGLLIKVQYKNKIGWIHKNMITDASTFSKEDYQIGANTDNQTVSSPSAKKSINAKAGEYNNNLISADIGYTTSKYINIDAAISVGLWYYGFSALINTDPGTKGKSYDKIINWDNDLDNVSNEGGYYIGAFGVDVGYYFLNNFLLGGGIGYAPYRLYRNFNDNTGILNDTGWYHVTKSDGGKIDAKAFVHYYFKKGLLGRFYLRAQYSIVGGAGLGVGLKFGN